MKRPERVTVLLPQFLEGPGAWRALGLAQALASAACDTRLLHWGRSASPAIQSLAGDVRLVPLELRPAWHPSRGRRLWGRARWLQWWQLGRNDIGAAIAEGRPDVVLVTQAWPGLVHQARRGLRQGAGGRGSGRLAIDLVDWHPRGEAQARRMRLTGRWTPQTAAEQVGRVTVVSEYAAESLGRGGAATLAVPPLFSGGIQQVAQACDSAAGRSSELAETRRHTEGSADPPPLRLLISGTAPWLDRGALANCINAVATLWDDARPDQPRVELHIAGHPRHAVEALPDVEPAALSGVVFHGPLKAPRIWALVAACDFLVLQRPADERWARMGFPSKISEAWTLGTPVITNLVSDVGSYARDGFNAVVLADDSLEAMSKGLARALAAGDAFDRGALAGWAGHNFAPEVYGEELRDFLLG